MSTRLDVILFYGYRLDYNDLSHEKTEEIYNSGRSYILTDGMCGEYIFIGRELGSVDGYGLNDDCDEAIIGVELRDLMDHKILSDALKDLEGYPVIASKVTGMIPKLYLIPHWH